MKKILLFLLIAAATGAMAQNNDYIVSMDGIGPVKIDMKQAELEKLLNKKIPLTNPWDTVSGAWFDSAIIKYKNVQLRLEFQRTYTDEKIFHMRVTGIETSSPLCKTKTGIGVGSDKLKIISVYETNPVSIVPDYTDDNYSTPSKTRGIILVKDNEYDKIVIFKMTNKKVTAIRVESHPSDQE